MTLTLIHSRKAQMRRGGCGSGLRGDYLHSSILAPEVAGPKARRAWRGARLPSPPHPYPTEAARPTPDPESGPVTTPLVAR